MVRNNSRSARILLCLAIVVLAANSGCRIRVPSVVEQEELVKRGAFPRGVPAWVGGPAENVGREHSALIPTNFSAGTGVISGAERSEQSRMAAVTLAGVRRGSETTSDDVQDRPNSPIGRVLDICPSLEQRVAAALTTTEPELRLERLKQLTVACPSSAELWFWLGKEYLANGQLIEAATAMRSVLVHEHDHIEARQMLISIEDQLNRRR